MSARMGDQFIKLSTTTSLNKIRKDKEMEKGWRKGDLSVTEEINELDLVHVLPLVGVKIVHFEHYEHVIL